MAYSTKEVKSGIFITLSLVLLVGLTFIVGHYSHGPMKSIVVQFGYVSGLKKDAPVHFSGHEVGRVTDIDIMPQNERPIIVTLQVSTKVVLKENSDAFVDTLGMLGEKFVELTPGTLDSPILEPNKIIKGTDPIPMYQLIQKMNLLADRMDLMSQSLNPLLETVNVTLQGHREDIAQIITNINETSANLRDMTHDLKFKPWRLLRKG